MIKHFLVTYMRMGLQAYEWFETEEEMNDFLNICEENDYSFIEKFRVKEIEEIL